MRRGDNVDQDHKFETLKNVQTEYNKLTELILEVRCIAADSETIVVTAFRGAANPK
jgi:hypothetical protein